MEHSLPPLPYPENALEPHMSAETLAYHHGKHHLNYVTKLNELIKGTKYSFMPLEEIILSSTDTVYNNAAQVWNHTFFWSCLAPNSGGNPTGKIAEIINHNWGSFEAFQKEFEEHATTNFGSGWTWLVKNNKNQLQIINTSNADTPKSQDLKALLTVDVWEHAYYIDYRNERDSYLKGFWNLVNWDFVNKNYQQGMA